MPEENNGGNVVPTPAQNSGNAQSVQPANGNTPNGANATAKSFTQEDIDRIINERLSRAEEKFLKKAGVSSFEELENKLNDGQSAKVNLILTKQNIAEEKQDDVITHFKGKGLEITEQALAEAVKTRPEWLKKVSAPTNSQPQVIKIGQSENKEPKNTDYEDVNKMFGTNIGKNVKHRI